MKEIQKNYSVHMILSIETILICLWGGIYDFTFAIYGTVFFVSLCGMSWSKKILIPRNITTYCLGILFLGTLISLFQAQDKGVAFIGVLRIVMLAGFWILWSNISYIYRDKLIEWIPDISATLTGITVFLYFFPVARKYLFRADRMGGVFQYSNTYAMFLLIAVVILFYKSEGTCEKKRDYRRYAEFCILLCGIVFCGSRSVMVLAVITIASILIFEHKDRKLWIPILGITVVLCLFLQILLKLDVQRLVKITLDSSTLNGRFLYWQDALHVIGNHPLGLGYMGYYFLQPQFQTGNYVTKFVHNDILQCALDMGVVAAIALLVMIVANIWNTKNIKRNKILLLLMLLHCLFDFDLQYSAMFCLLLMCMDVEEDKHWEWKGISSKIVMILTAGVCIYFSVAFGMSQFNQNKAALALYPGNTFAREARMLEDENNEDAEIIIAKNGMIASAYECAAERHLDNGEYMEAYKDIQGMLRTAGYQIEHYNQAVYKLSMALDQAVRKDDMDGAQEILEEIQGIPEQIAGLEARTSDFAYKINDKPTFQLQDEIERYIESLSGISLK